MFTQYPGLAQIPGQEERRTVIREGIWNGGYGQEITIPFGFITDGASVPMALWSIFPPYGEYEASAVLHDYLYKEHAITRFNADGIFRQAMVSQGVPFWKIWLMWAAVRLCGAGHFVPA